MDRMVTTVAKQQAAIRATKPSTVHAMTDEGLARKARSEAILQACGIPIHDRLPWVADASQVQPRDQHAVAMRALSLLVVALKAEGLEQATVDRLIVDFDLAAALSPDEQAFVADPNPSEITSIQFLWRYEAAWTLLWALGHVETLSPPTAICDAPAAVKVFRESNRAAFLEASHLRSVSELLDAQDLIYRYHWAVRQARLNGEDMPGGVDQGVVMERHHALNWLVGWKDQPWDEVTCDT